MCLNTHNLGRKTGTVREVGDRVVEVIQIRFISRLKLMEEVEEAVGKRGMRSDHSGGEPIYLEELATAVGGIPWDALAVLDDDLVDSGEVENCKLISSRRVGTFLAERVTS